MLASMLGIKVTMYRRDRCLDDESSQVKFRQDSVYLTCGGKQQLLKVGMESVILLVDTVIFQSSVNDLGVTIDSPLTMCDHVQKICRSSSYQLSDSESSVALSLSTPAPMHWFMQWFQAGSITVIVCLRK